MVPKETKAIEAPEGLEIPTEVKGVSADAEIPQGMDRIPVFDVDKNTFYQNMTWGRKRVRFPSGHKAQAYMQGTGYMKPFFIRHKDESGKAYLRKVK